MKRKRTRSVIPRRGSTRGRGFGGWFRLGGSEDRWYTVDDVTCYVAAEPGGWSVFLSIGDSKAVQVGPRLIPRRWIAKLAAELYAGIAANAVLKKVAKTSSRAFSAKGIEA